MAKKEETIKEEKIFNWTGIDIKGNKIKGETTAYNENMAKTILRQQKINPTQIKKKNYLFGLGKKKSKKIQTTDIAVLARQITTMMQAGVPLVQGLNIIAKGADNAKMKNLVNNIHDDIEEGETFALALSKHPKYFDDLFVNLVAAGEESGALETLLDKIATYKEKTEAIRKKVKKALVYPSAVMVVAFIVMFVLLYFVVPQFQSLFRGFGADLPAFTMLVIGMSDFVQTWWWGIIGFVGALGACFRLGVKHSAKFRAILDKVMLKLPVIGDIQYNAAVARFARTLGTMFAAGVPLVEALQSVSKAAGNNEFYNAIIQMCNQVETGQSLRMSMANTGLFPTMAVQMITIGEESGSLDDMCNRVADFYEEEVDSLVDSLSSLLEPFIMAILGVMVGGLVIAMYLPIFKLGSVV